MNCILRKKEINNYLETNNISRIDYLWRILNSILTQLARINPTLPTTRLSNQDRNKNIHERMTIRPLYLSNSLELMAANTYASVTPLMAL